MSLRNSLRWRSIFTGSDLITLASSAHTMALKAVDKDVLVRAVNELCHTNEDFARALWTGIEWRQAKSNSTSSNDKVLIPEAPKSAASTNKRSLASISAAPTSAAPAPKRPRGKAAVCTNCGVPFNTGSSASCQHHTGRLETDYNDDCWADHDERCHGRIDGTACKVDYPDSYTWSCCGRQGDYEGCRRGPGHVAVGGKSDQARLVLRGLKLTRKNKVKEISSGTGQSREVVPESADEETASGTDEDYWDE